jgi:hypothetical protein
MSYTTTRYALIALTEAGGQYVGVDDVNRASADLMGAPVPLKETLADLGSMHDYGQATVVGDRARYEGLIVLAPDGRRYAAVTLDRYAIAEPIGGDTYNSTRLPEHVLELIPRFNGLVLRAS